MKRFLSALCALLLAFGQPSFASITTTGAGKVPAGGGGGGYTGPLDVVGTSVAHCYAVRACSAAWADGTHKAIHLVRASDSQGCDIYINTSGGLGNTVGCVGGTVNANGTPVATFCSSTTCSVDILYDQMSTGAVNATQGTSAAQPVLQFSDGTNCTGITTGLPCIHFSGSVYLATANTVVGLPVSIGAVARRATSPAGVTTSYNTVIGAANGAYFNNSPSEIFGFFGASMTATSGTTVTDGSWHELAWIASSSTNASGISADGTVTATAAAMSGGLSADSFIGASSSTPGNPLTGDISEVEVYAAAITFATGSGQSNTLCHNQRLYWGNTGSC